MPKRGVLGGGAVRLDVAEEEVDEAFRRWRRLPPHRAAFPRWILESSILPPLGAGASDRDRRRVGVASAP
jgi:hypothetical protein